MTENDLPTLSIADLQSLLRRREISPREVIDALQTRVAAVDGKIGAYLSFDLEGAAEEAEKANVDLPLGGVPLAIKDIINVMGQPCTCASKILHGYRSIYDATVIRKLRAVGAIPFGKTNLDEFAMGSSTENSAMKLTRNPWDLSRVPGGSSGDRRQQSPPMKRLVRWVAIPGAPFVNRLRFRALSVSNRLMAGSRDSVWSRLLRRSIKSGR